MNILLLDDIALINDIIELDETLDDEEDRLNDEAAWEWLEKDDDYDEEFENAWDDRCDLENAVIDKTEMPVEKVKSLSNEELEKIINTL